MTFTPTRSEGLQKLSHFIGKAGRDYARLRNSDYGRNNHDHVSGLSPYLRHRLITEREVVMSVLKHHDLAECEKFVQEVFWRTYYKGWFEHNPHIWARYKADLQEAIKTLAEDKIVSENYNQALAGQTNIACFDYWVSELIDTGYLHNHARMWFASIWIFTLKLPWMLGADFFLRHLLDGDPASNTLSWRWVAGLHTKGKTYLARPENIERFTNGRFNPEGQLASFAEPLVEIEGDLETSKLPQTGLTPNQPFFLLVHEDDCLPENLLRNRQKPDGVFGVTTTSFRSPLAVDDKVKVFAKRAVANGIDRSNFEPILFEDNWTDFLVQSCVSSGIKNIVTAYMPVGPNADALSKARATLNQAGITVTQIIRPWDRTTWPYANRGFFKVKKKMSRILDALKENDTQGELL